MGGRIPIKAVNHNHEVVDLGLFGSPLEKKWSWSSPIA